QAPDAVRIILTAYTDVDSLMEAINTGRIYHFVPKPWEPNDLIVIVQRAAERHALGRENARLRDELEVAYNALRRDLAAERARPPSTPSSAPTAGCAERPTSHARSSTATRRCC